MGKFSKSDAQKDALAQCAQWGASDCRIDLAFKNTCVAAATAGGGRGTKIHTGADVGVAQARALKDCQVTGGGRRARLFTAVARSRISRRTDPSVASLLMDADAAMCAVLR